MVTGVRAQIAEALADVVPAGWRVVPYERDLDPPRNVTVMVRQRSFSWHPAAPQGNMLATVVLTIISPHQDTQLAEDELDDVVPPFVFNTLRDVAWLRWTGSADKVIFAGTNPAWDVTVECYTEIGD